MLAVSGNQTFVIYLYADGLIQWTRDGEALAGYNVGDGIFSYTIPLSLKEDIRNITSTSNVGRPGMWVFRVDQEDLFNPSCEEICQGKKGAT